MAWTKHRKKFSLSIQFYTHACIGIGTGTGTATGAGIVCASVFYMRMLYTIAIFAMLNTIEHVYLGELNIATAPYL